MTVAITAAIAQLVAGLKPGTWTVAFYHGHAVLKVHTALQESKQKVYDAKGEHIGWRWGLPDGHDGWDCSVITPEGEVIGEHTSIGQAIETARVSARRRNGLPDEKLAGEQPEKPEPAADAASAVPAPRAGVPAADPATAEVNALLDTKVDQLDGALTIETEGDK